MTLTKCKEAVAPSVQLPTTNPPHLPAPSLLLLLPLGSYRGFSWSSPVSPRLQLGAIPVFKFPLSRAAPAAIGESWGLKEVLEARGVFQVASIDKALG